MKDTLETIIKTLVDDENENEITFQVEVAENDVGKVIGRQGKMAKAIRTLIKAVAGKENKKVYIEFLG